MCNNENGRESFVCLPGLVVVLMLGVARCRCGGDGGRPSPSVGGSWLFMGGGHSWPFVGGGRS